MSPEGITQMVADLKQASHQLLEQGLDEAGHLSSSLQMGFYSYTGILRIIKWFGQLLPNLLQQLDEIEDRNQHRWRLSRVPLRAKLPRAPHLYRKSPAQAGGQTQLYPDAWEVRDPILMPNLQALRWVLHILQRHGQRLSNERLRLFKQIDEAHAVRTSETEYSRSDREALEEIRAELDEGDAALKRLQTRIYRAMGRRQQPSPRLPAPYPQGAAWRQLRRHWNYLENPELAFSWELATFLDNPINSADLPFLYQRWCGLRLLQEAQDMGWYTLEDKIGPLFLGGRLTLRKDGTEIILWSQAKIGRRSHPSGLVAETSRELAPDYLLITPGPQGPDAFVLDPTMSSDPDLHRKKGRYINLLRFEESVLCGGVPVRRCPNRAWAIAPLQADHCKALHPEGRFGAIPLDPERHSTRALRSWLRDIFEHATAWQNFYTLQAARTSLGISPPRTKDFM